MNKSMNKSIWWLWITVCENPKFKIRILWKGVHKL